MKLDVENILGEVARHVSPRPTQVKVSEDVMALLQGTVQEQPKQEEPAVDTGRQQWLDSLQKHEGRKNVVYRDSRGKLTGGIGRLLEGTDFQEGDELDDATVDRWFQADSEEALASAKRLNERMGLGLDEQATYAMASWIFQLGASGVTKFKNTLEALKNKEDFEAFRAHAEDSEWQKQTPKRVAAMVEGMRHLFEGQS